LDDCVRFLEGLLLKAQSLGARIKSKKWFRVGINQSTWWFYKGDFEDLAKELFEWTQRFDIHTFSLPNSIKTVINLETEPAHLHSTSSPLSLLAVQQRVAKVVELDGDARVNYGEQLHVEDHESRIVSGRTISQPAATRSYSRRNVYPQRMATFDGQPVVLEERDIWRHFSYENHRHLASVLSQADSSVGLLKCLGFYNLYGPSYRGPDQGGTIFIFKMPKLPTPAPVFETLHDVVCNSSLDSDGKMMVPNHSLSQRYKLARRISIALLFVQSVGWVHKSIRPANILIAGDANFHSPRNISDAYLAGFTLARSE
jgi:hypothetical protein